MPVDRAFPASFAQERVWNASQADPASSVENIALRVWLPPGIGADTVASALRLVVARHEPLRTYFRADDDGLHQVVRGEVKVAVAHDELYDDLRAVAADRLEFRLYAILRAEARIPFELDRPPLWRARLLLLAEDQWTLVVVAHHTVFDGTSAKILQAEMAAVCEARSDQPRLPDLPLRYADWSAWHRELWPNSVRAVRELAYWRDRLAGAPRVHALPLDRPRTAEVDHDGAEVRFVLAPAVTDRVARLARRLGVTEFAVLFAAYAAVVARWGGQPDVVVGVQVAGRNRAGAARLIGMFVNIVALRVTVEAGGTFEDLVRQVATITTEALRHSAVPTQLVVKEIVGDPAPGVASLCQLGFNLLPGVRLNYGYGTARDELCLEISGRDARVEYRTSLFDHTTMQAFVDSYLSWLDAASARPDLRVHLQ
jgi:hypothetical protein